MKLIIAILLLIAGCGQTSDVTTSVPPAENGERVTIYTHCGFYETAFDGESWTPASIARGGFPEGTDPIATAGTMRRVGDQALFVADSGLEVWFDPAPDAMPPPPPCY